MTNTDNREQKAGNSYQATGSRNEDRDVSQKHLNNNRSDVIIDDAIVDEKINQKKKRKFYKNLLQFFVWMILLANAYIYLQYNPAEKTSIVSSIEVLYQKAVVFAYSLVSANKAELLSEKYKFEMSFREVLELHEKYHCWTDADYTQLLHKYNELKSLSVDDYATQRIEYFDLVNVAYTKFNKDCKK